MIACTELCHKELIVIDPGGICLLRPFLSKSKQKLKLDLILNKLDVAERKTLSTRALETFSCQQDVPN